jgi:hypothetical protein
MLRKAPFPVFTWRVALKCYGGDPSIVRTNRYLTVTKQHSAPRGVLSISVTRAVLHSGADGKHALQG